MDLEKEDLDWIHLAQDKVHGRAVVNASTNGVRTLKTNIETFGVS
jgi:hypothetical protein